MSGGCRFRQCTLLKLLTWPSAYRQISAPVKPKRNVCTFQLIVKLGRGAAENDCKAQKHHRALEWPANCTKHSGAEFNTSRPSSEETPQIIPTTPPELYPKKSQSVILMLFLITDGKPKEYSPIYSSGLFLCIVRLATQPCLPRLFKITHLIVATWKAIHRSQGKDEWLLWWRGSWISSITLELLAYASHPGRLQKEAMLHSW